MVAWLDGSVEELKEVEEEVAELGGSGMQVVAAVAGWFSMPMLCRGRLGDDGAAAMGSAMAGGEESGRGGRVTVVLGERRTAGRGAAARIRRRRERDGAARWELGHGAGFDLSCQRKQEEERKKKKKLKRKEIRERKEKRNKIK
jgi:hypothetical protein